MAYGMIGLAAPDEARRGCPKKVGILKVAQWIRSEGSAQVRLLEIANAERQSLVEPLVKYTHRIHLQALPDWKAGR